ncbi:MAG: two-component sensor histidine kinase, partial [Proteobacteria bacterium]|nr:two-component sensor histidine kinase [Pseudomonadota bacterium]
ARVGPSLGGRRDEVAVLGHEFDRMAERIETLVEAQKRLLRDISHELRSPLARLNVALGLARQKAAAAAESSLDRIEREAERLNELIGQLLTLTSLEGGAEGIARETLDLTGLVCTVTADADFEARGRGRSVQMGACAAVAIQAAPELIRRALENVIRNAVSFTAAGTPVEVSLEQEGAVARVTVRDHGPGVPETALEAIFRPFYRVADARDRQSGGTGIGLAITDRAVRLHGGSVRAENAPGGGLAVILTLPVLLEERFPPSE